MRKPTNVQGTRDLLLLKIVALEPLHGSALARRLQEVSRDMLQVIDRSLYSALERLSRAISPVVRLKEV
jgi:DNA-binding PadR family transcriptional regulator